MADVRTKRAPNNVPRKNAQGFSPPRRREEQKKREREKGKQKEGKYERKYERLVVTCAPGTGKNNEETREET